MLIICYIINLLPYSFWGERSLCALDTDLNHLRILGCSCFVKDIHTCDKFASCLNPFVLMGYVINQKGYIVMDLRDCSFSISWDVHILENAFPISVSKGDLSYLITTATLELPNAPPFDTNHYASIDMLTSEILSPATNSIN